MKHIGRETTCSNLLSATVRFLEYILQKNFQQEKIISNLNTKIIILLPISICLSFKAVVPDEDIMSTHMFCMTFVVIIYTALPINSFLFWCLNICLILCFKYNTLSDYSKFAILFLFLFPVFITAFFPEGTRGLPGSENFACLPLPQPLSPLFDQSLSPN